MSEKTCPHCGYDNSDAIGVFRLSGPNPGFDVSTFQCENCNRVFERGDADDE